MTTDEDLTAAFWKHLRSDRTVMLGLANGPQTELRPMTAQMEDNRDHGPIWFFTSTESDLVKDVGGEDLALFGFVSKGHEIFATVHGHMTLATSPEMIDRLWSPWIAAWYEQGKEDPSIALLRFDPSKAEIWRNGSSLMAGLKLLLGSDPQKDYESNIAKVSLD